MTLSLSACGALALAAEPRARTGSDTLLQSAARLVELFPNDEDAKNDYRYKVAQRFLEGDRWEEAKALTERMGESYLRGELSAQLALKAAIRHDIPKAKAWQDKAAKIAVIYQDQWQADRIHARNLVVSDFLGEHDAAPDEAARLKDLESRLLYRVERVIAAAESGEEITLTMPAEAQGNEVKGVPEVLLYPRGILRVAKLVMARKPEQKVPDTLLSLFDLAVDICRKSGVMSINETIGIAGFLVEHGEKKAAVPALTAALQQLNRTKFVPGALAAVARVYAAAGDLPSARRALADAERLEAGLQPMEQPPVLAAIACGYAKCGEAGKADALMMEALRRAKANPNPRTAMINAVGVSLVLYDLGVTAPEGFARELEAIGNPATGEMPR